MWNKPEQGSPDDFMREIQRIREVLHNIDWEEIDREVADDEDSRYEEADWDEIQLRKERATADKEAELAKKEQQKNKYRLPFAILSGVVAVGWLIFTAVLIVKSGSEKSQVVIDYRVLIAMIGTAFGTMYTPLRILAKYLFNGHDG